MTEYRALKGIKVKTVSSDPPAAVGEGQMWYNSSALDYKTSVKVKAWASGGNLTAARSTGGGAGTQTAGLYAGGQTPPDSEPTSTTPGGLIKPRRSVRILDRKKLRTNMKYS